MLIKMLKADTNLSSLSLLVTWTGIVPPQYVRRRFFSAFSRVTQNHLTGGSRERAVLWTWSADRGRLHGLCHGAGSTGSLVSFMPWWIQTGETDVKYLPEKFDTSTVFNPGPIFTLNKRDVVTWSAPEEKITNYGGSEGQVRNVSFCWSIFEIELNHFLSCVGK